MLRGLTARLSRRRLLVLLVVATIAIAGTASAAHACQGGTDCTAVAHHDGEGAMLLHGGLDDALVASALLIAALLLFASPLDARRQRIMRSPHARPPRPPGRPGAGRRPRRAPALVELQRFLT